MIVWDNKLKYREAVTSGRARFGGIIGRNVCRSEWGGGGDCLSVDAHNHEQGQRRGTYLE